MGRVESAIDERRSARGSGGRPSVVAMFAVVVVNNWEVSGGRSKEISLVMLSARWSDGVARAFAEVEATPSATFISFYLHIHFPTLIISYEPRRKYARVFSTVYIPAYIRVLGITLLMSHLCLPSNRWIACFYARPTSFDYDERCQSLFSPSTTSNRHPRYPGLQEITPLQLALHIWL
jgi:hypothetical protein